MSVRRPFPRLAMALVCSLACSLATAADATAIRAIVDRAVRPVLAQHEVPGMAVAVTVDGEALFFNYGLASKEAGTPVTEDTLFELGSISKTFTATLATYAQAQGKLSLDDHPGRTIAQLKGSALDRATLLELGTYTAANLPLQVPDAVQDDAQMLAWLVAWEPDAAPGTQRRYSNPSIGLFGRIAAMALGRDFGEALERQLFPALGLAHSHVRVPAGSMANYAWGYDKEGKPVRVRPDVFAPESYGVKSSAADMIRFIQANIDPRLLAAPLRQAVEGTQVGYYQAGPMVQGLGWEQYRAPLGLARLLEGNSPAMIEQANPVAKLAPLPAPPGTLFNKTGATRGFGAYAAFIPERKIGIVMLANKNYPIAARVTAAHAILEQLAQPPRDTAAR
ncbi:class C beta-lactamase [Massilia haematophila]|uniref:Beta-lactamase n=1 Tax=Massilia haematophila TaxID=457923 RepID=A0ABV7PMF4_9BURK